MKQTASSGETLITEVSMSLEMEELKAQIIRRFKRRLNSLGVVRIDLITREEPVRTSTGSLFARLKKSLSATILVRVCEVALLLSVLPRILPNFKLNYEHPARAVATIACSITDHFTPNTRSNDPFAPLGQVEPEMTVGSGTPPMPLPPCLLYTSDAADE